MQRALPWVMQRNNFPDTVDGWSRQAEVHHARGLRKQAAIYYREAAHMALQQEGFEGIQDWFDLADELDADTADPEPPGGIGPAT